jgi:outer membrane receptor protein involved in Fe transport
MMSSAMALAAVMGWGTAPALAQQAASTDEGIEEIIVTVQKREEAIVDVPVAITAYSGETLQQLGITQFDELALFVPGLEVQEQSPNNPGFVIRGLTSDDGAAFQEQRVAVFQDGVSISRARGAFVELFDVERIEVARGPQATLFGRAALSGGINVIRRKANLDAPGGEAALSVGDYGLRRYEFAGGAPLIEGVLGVRAAVVSTDREGNQRNILGGRLNGPGANAQRLSVAWVPRDDMRFDLQFERQEDSWDGTGFKSGSIAPALLAPNNLLVNVPGASVSPFTFAALNTSGALVEGGNAIGIQRDIAGATLLGNWEVTDAIQLDAIIAYREFDATEVFDPDGTPLPILLVAEDATGTQRSAELRVSYDAGGAFSGFAGVSFFQERARQRVPLQLSPVGLAWLANGANPSSPLNGSLALARTNPAALNAVLFPVGGGVVLPLPQAIAASATVFNEFQNFGRTISYDLFADGTFAVTDSLSVSAGVRFSTDDKRTGVTSATNGTPLLVGAIPGGAVASRSQTFDGVSWRLVGRYALADDLNVYASYNRGRRPDVLQGSAPGPGSVNASFTVIPAEEIDSFEVGLKGRVLDGALGFEGAVYRYNYENFQTTAFNQAGQIITVNAGSAEATGFESQLDVRAFEGVTLIGTYAWNDSQLTTGARNGNRFRLSPEHSLSLAADITLPVGSLFDLSFRPSYTWQSEVFFDDDNDRADLQVRPQPAFGAGANFTDRAVDETQDAYGVLNLRLVATLQAAPVSVEAFVTNVTNEDFIIDAGNTGDNFGIPTFIRGNPRFVGVTVRGAF